MYYIYWKFWTNIKILRIILPTLTSYLCIFSYETRFDAYSLTYFVSKNCILSTSSLSCTFCIQMHFTFLNKMKGDFLLSFCCLLFEFASAKTFILLSLQGTACKGFALAWWQLCNFIVRQVKFNRFLHPNELI